MTSMDEYEVDDQQLHLNSDDDYDSDHDIDSTDDKHLGTDTGPDTADAAEGGAKPSFYYFVALLYAFMMMGIHMGLLGPSLLELALQVDATINEMAFGFSLRSVGMLGGALGGGWLIDKYPHRGKLMLALAVLSFCSLSIAIPFSPNLFVLIVLASLQGALMGIDDNLSQILLIRHYKKDVGPYMQALHGFFGCGALVSPLVLSPFLGATGDASESGDIANTNVEYDPAFHYAWIICACCGFPCFVWMMYYSIRDEFGGQWKDLARLAIYAESTETSAVDSNSTITTSAIDDHAEVDDSSWLSADNQPSFLAESTKRAEYRFSMQVVLITGLFLSLYVGCETGFGSYIYSYAVIEVDFSNESAAYLNSGYWAIFAIGRMIGVPVSMVWSAQRMVTVDLMMAIVSVIIILSSVHNTTAICLGTALYGLSVASVYASAINYCEQLVGVNGKLLSYLTFFAVLGDAVVPLIMGSLFTSPLGPVSIMWVSVIVAASATTVFTVLAMVIAPRKPKFDAHPHIELNKPHIAIDTIDESLSGSYNDSDDEDEEGAEHDRDRPRALV